MARCIGFLRKLLAILETSIDNCQLGRYTFHHVILLIFRSFLTVQIAFLLYDTLQVLFCLKFLPELIRNLIYLDPRPVAFTWNAEEKKIVIWVYWTFFQSGGLKISNPRIFKLGWNLFESQIISSNSIFPYCLVNFTKHHEMIWRSYNSDLVLYQLEPHPVNSTSSIANRKKINVADGIPTQRWRWLT